jgi:SAM-dependent methyltransferase
MGLYGIANTISLKRMYETEYGGKAIYFTPRINAAVFYPAESANGPNPRKPLQVFCYGRPKHPRNAFELVRQAMRQLKAKLGNRVRIVSAGDEWRPSDYDLQGIVENLGLLSYEDTGRLYRESEVGVVMMLTRHPSYIPLELMASGCLAVTNVNAWTSWLLKDGENCLLSAATATAIADNVERALLDTALRDRIRVKALAMVRSEYLDWSSQAESVFAYLCDPENRLEAEGPVADPVAAPARTEELIPVGEYRIPARLVRLTGCEPKQFQSYGNAQFRNLQKYLQIRHNDSVLEIGCGVGRLAIPATRIINSEGSYLGVDIIGDSIDWCASHITPRLPHFRFHFEDIASQIHNPSGCKDPASTRIPLPDASVDKVFLASVFTHMFPVGVHNYLSEFRRILKPGGVVLSTMFLLNSVSRESIQNGETHWTFSHQYEASGCCWIDSLDFPEGAVAYDEEGYLAMIRQHDMDILQRVVYGRWSARPEPSEDGQDYVIFGPIKR